MCQIIWHEGFDDNKAIDGTTTADGVGDGDNDNEDVDVEDKDVVSNDLGEDYGTAWNAEDLNTEEKALVDPSHLDPVTGDYIGPQLNEQYRELFKTTYKQLLMKLHPDKNAADVIGTVDEETGEVITEEIIEQRREKLA